MEYGTITGLDKPLARVIYGAQSINQENRSESFALLDEITAAGATAVDTAHEYSGGDSERVLGEWLEARSNRDDLVIITKGSHYNRDRNRVTPFDIMTDVHDSLARLRTDYVDIYLLHRDDPTVRVEPIIDTLNALVAEGKIRCFGASNWRRERIQEANSYAARTGQKGFTASSVQYSLAIEYDRPHPGTLSLRSKEPRDGAEDEGWYRETRFPLLAWSSLARGFFSGKIDRHNMGGLTSASLKTSARCYGYEENFKRLDRLRDLAEARGSPIAQIALAFVFSQPLNTCALVGSRDANHFLAAVDALDLVISPAELAWLDLETDETPF